MSVLTPLPDTTGKNLFEDVANWRLRDDASDNKSGGSYSHKTIEWSATEANEWVAFFQYIANLFKNSGVALQVRNETGLTLAAGPIRVTGYSAANNRFLIGLADADTNLPANAVLLTSLATATNGIAYAGGELATSGVNTTAAAVGDKVYLSATGTMTLSAPTGADQIAQEIGRVKTIAVSATLQLQIQSPERFGTSWHQPAAITDVKRSPRTVTAKVASYPLLATECHQTFTNFGTAIDITFTLPAGAAGLRYKICRVAAFNVIVSGGTIHWGELSGASCQLDTRGMIVLEYDAGSAAWIVEALTSAQTGLT